MKKRKIHEAQGVDVNIDELEDEVWVRNDKGELVKVEVADDVEDDQAQ